MHCVNLNLHHYTNRFIRQIRYKESRLRVKLRHQYRRHSVSKKKIINVYRQIIVDFSKASLNQIQLDYLSHNGKLKSLLNSYSIYSILYLIYFCDIYYFFSLIRTELY